MPEDPPSPPPPDWDTSSDFSNAQSLAQKNGYDATNQAIKDDSGNPLYLIVAKSSGGSGHVAWALSSQSNANGCVCCLIPSATFTLIENGSLSQSTGVISYSGHTYQLVVKAGSSSGSVQACAVQLT